MLEPLTVIQEKQLLLMPKGIIKWLVIIVFLLLIANIVGNVLGLLQPDSLLTMIMLRYFDFNGEGNIPAFFSSIILLVAAGLLFLTHALQQGLPANKRSRYWFILGLFFVFLSLDENVQIHEQVTNFVRPKLENDLSGFLYWAWVVPYAVLALAVAAYFFRFVLQLPYYTRNLFFLSGALYVTGALGLELFEGYFFKHYGLDHLYNLILYCLEELMEMSGVVLFIYALLHYLAVRNTQVAITLGDRLSEKKI
jgi:hypothetical protein